jgi:hypothetical protein
MLGIQEILNLSLASPVGRKFLDWPCAGARTAFAQAANGE